MRASKADKFYMGMLLAIICFCFGLLRIMDEADARRAAERETLIIVEPPTIVVPASQPVQTVYFEPDPVSYVGCYGLMQLNPDYFPADLSPAENIQYGVAFIAEKLDQYAGNVGAALTAYNAGHDTGNREYAEKVMAAAERWRTE